MIDSFTIFWNKKKWKAKEIMIEKYKFCLLNKKDFNLSLQIFLNAKVHFIHL